MPAIWIWLWTERVFQLCVLLAFGHLVAHLPLRSHPRLIVSYRSRALLAHSGNSDWQEARPMSPALTLPDGVGFLYGELAAQSSGWLWRGIFVAPARLYSLLH